MIIKNAVIALNCDHQFLKRSETSESLRSWKTPAQPRDSSALSNKNLLSDKGMLIFTSHLHEFGNLVMENIFREVFGNDVVIESEQLFVKEAEREIKLPCGYVVMERRDSLGVCDDHKN